MEVNIFSESTELEDDVHPPTPLPFTPPPPPAAMTAAPLPPPPAAVAAPPPPVPGRPEKEEAGEEVAEEDTGTLKSLGTRRKRRKNCPLYKELLQLSLSLLNLH